MSLTEAQPRPTPAVERFIEGLPKAELHVHHVGSASPAIVAELAARHPARCRRTLRPWLTTSRSPTSPTSSSCTCRSSTSYAPLRTSGPSPTASPRLSLIHISEPTRLRRISY